MTWNICCQKTVSRSVVSGFKYVQKFKNSVNSSGLKFLKFTITIIILLFHTWFNQKLAMEGPSAQQLEELRLAEVRFILKYYYFI